MFFPLYRTRIFSTPYSSRQLPLLLFLTHPLYSFGIFHVPISFLSLSLSHFSCLWYFTSFASLPLSPTPTSLALSPSRILQVSSSPLLQLSLRLSHSLSHRSILFTTLLHFTSPTSYFRSLTSIASLYLSSSLFIGLPHPFPLLSPSPSVSSYLLNSPLFPFPRFLFSFPVNLPILLPLSCNLSFRT